MSHKVICPEIRSWSLCPRPLSSVRTADRRVAGGDQGPSGVTSDSSSTGQGARRCAAPPPSHTPPSPASLDLGEITLKPPGPPASSSVERRLSRVISKHPSPLDHGSPSQHGSFCLRKCLLHTHSPPLPPMVRAQGNSQGPAPPWAWESLTPQARSSEPTLGLGLLS